MLARKAIGLDDLSPRAHALLGSAAVMFGDYDRALDELKRAIELNASDAESYRGLLQVLLWRGDTAGAIAAAELLRQFQPNISIGDAFHLGTAYVLADRGADAVRVLEQAVERNPGALFNQVMLIAAYATAGRQQEAARQAQMVHQRFPGYSFQEFGSLLRDPEQREKLARVLKTAGL
jgi:adenylate cyclase